MMLKTWKYELRITWSNANSIIFNFNQQELGVQEQKRIRREASGKSSTIVRVFTVQLKTNID